VDEDGVSRFRSKVDAFKKAQGKNPGATREKVSGFLLFVGSEPSIVEVGEDRDSAIAHAVSLLKEQDTVVFLGKAISKIGQSIITKDQLLLTRKNIDV